MNDATFPAPQGRMPHGTRGADADRLLREERERLAAEMFDPVVMRLSRAVLDAHALHPHLENAAARQRLVELINEIDAASRALRRTLLEATTQDDP